MCPSQTPLTISGKSLSLRGVLPFAPLRRRSRSARKSSRESGMPAGTPSSTTPISGPCDSPKIESLNFVPYEFIAN